ncbi:unnamed protein product, partial [Musa banksii]
MQRSVRSRRIFFLSLPFYAIGRTDAFDPELGLLRPDPGCRRPLLRLAVSSSSRNGRRDIPGSLYDIAVKDMDGNDVNLGSYSGKVLLIVNVASKCGFTNSNYKEMNVLYDKYKDKGQFEVLAFPCNQFASQEPGTIEEIKETACTVFKAEFPIFDKV